MVDPPSAPPRRAGGAGRATVSWRTGHICRGSGRAPSGSRVASLAKPPEVEKEYVHYDTCLDASIDIARHKRSRSQTEGAIALVGCATPRCATRNARSPAPSQRGAAMFTEIQRYREGLRAYIAPPGDMHERILLERERCRRLRGRARGEGCGSRPPPATDASTSRAPASGSAPTGSGPEPALRSSINMSKNMFVKTYPSRLPPLTRMASTARFR